MIILVDGPEKVGKTTWIKYLEVELAIYGYNVRKRHWGPINPDDRVYTEELREAVSSNDVVIWDRSWPSEHIYAKLLNRDRRLRDDPWLGEWLHGRALTGRGMRIILLPEDPAECAKRHDRTDLPVNPMQEIRAYADYAERFHYQIYLLNYTKDRCVETAHHAANTFMVSRTLCGIPPVRITGPTFKPQHVILVLGEAISPNPGMPGAWLPFSSTYTTKFARLFGDAALNVYWSNIDDVPSFIVRNADIIVTCGMSSYEGAANFHLRDDQELVAIAHPSYAFRWNNDNAARLLENMTKLIEPVIKVAEEDWRACGSPQSTVNA